MNSFALARLGPRGDPAQWTLLRSLAAGLTVLMPWLLLHTQAGTEACIDIVGAAFLGHCVVERRWAWLRQGWVPFALAWWGWLVFCTVLDLSGAGLAALPQSLMVARFLLFAAALQHWVLAGTEARKWLFRSIAAATLYVVAQTVLQFATGHNLFGAPVSEDGELTGPFAKPRAGPTYVRMLFPVLVPAGYALIADAHGRLGRWGGRVAGIALFAAAIGVSVLIGQRMPLVLTAFGLLVMALLLPRLRAVAAIALLVGAILLPATAVFAPPAFYRLVTKFSRQMADFGDSPYGLIAQRSVAIAEQHPLFGRGYDGFRSGCALPRYFQGWHWPTMPASGDGGGAAMCATHPHSYYLQAVTDAGLPGLLLFCALVGAWLYALARGLRRSPDALRVGLFVAAFIQLWPIESTSPIISLPIGAWFFLLLGFGLAASDAARAREP